MYSISGSLVLFEVTVLLHKHQVRSNIGCYNGYRIVQGQPHSELQVGSLPVAVSGNVTFSWPTSSCWSFDRKTYTWSSPKSSRSWNPADFMKSVKSGGFHEIREIRRISPVKSGRFHEIQWILWNPWNPADFTLKSGGFHEIREIRQISYGFHEIRRISCEIERPLQGIVTLCLVMVQSNI